LCSLIDKICASRTKPERSVDVNSKRNFKSYHDRNKPERTVLYRHCWISHFRGGVSLTVTGSNFDAVEKPMLKVDRVLQTIEIQGNATRVINETVLTYYEVSVSSLFGFYWWSVRFFVVYFEAVFRSVRFHFMCSCVFQRCDKLNSSELLCITPNMGDFNATSWQTNIIQPGRRRRDIGIVKVRISNICGIHTYQIIPNDSFLEYGKVDTVKTFLH